MTPPLVLTLRLDAVASETLNLLRRTHFPVERNFLDAHVTLFHALPGRERPALHDALRAVCSETGPFPVHLPGLRFLGRGVAVEVESAGLCRLRGRLAAQWAAWLSAQDRQGYRPHVTIQNKVTPGQARALYEELVAGWPAMEAQGQGLDLWNYAGGPWEFISEYAFGGWQ